MIRKEEALLYSLLELFEQYDSSTINSIVSKLTSKEFDNYLKARDALVKLAENKPKSQKKQQSDKDDPDYEKQQAIKGVKRLLKTIKPKSDDLKRAFASVFTRDPNINFESDMESMILDVESILQNETVEKIRDFESVLMKSRHQGEKSNSLENWSSIIVRNSSDNGN